MYLFSLYGKHKLRHNVPEQLAEHNKQASTCVRALHGFSSKLSPQTWCTSFILITIVSSSSSSISNYSDDGLTLSTSRDSCIYSFIVVTVGCRCDMHLGVCVCVCDVHYVDTPASQSANLVTDCINTMISLYDRQRAVLCHKRDISDDLRKTSRQWIEREQRVMSYSHVRLRSMRTGRNNAAATMQRGQHPAAAITNQDLWPRCNL